VKKFLGLLLAVSTAAHAAPIKRKTLGNVNAPKGGTMYYNLPSEPSTLNPITSSDFNSTQVQGYALESLGARNSDTYEWEPSLAESWEVSKDNKIFTFKIRQGVKWSDGQPMTAADVKFSFDVIFDPNYDTAHLRPYFDGIEKVELVDPTTVRFTAKDQYFKNFDSAIGITVIPKHIYEGKKAEGKLNKTLVGTGPYTLDKYDQGQRIVLKKNKEWWGNSVPELKGQWNFDSVVFRFVKEENVALEMLKKGDLDYLDDMRAEVYVEKTKGPEWGTKVFKVKYQSSAPKPYGFIAWNFKNPLFQDRNVRVALAHLYNRKFVIEKFLYGMAVPATGPIHVASPYASSKVKPFEYDPKKAVELLKKSGWSDTDKDGVLDKQVDGKSVPFRFTLITANADTMKFYTGFKEDAKKVGVDIELKLLEWNSFVKLLDEQKFDAVTLRWAGGSVDPDPKQIWHSVSAVAGGSNFISYKNSAVDKMIDDYRLTFDRKQRIAKFHKIYETIAEDAPYLFLFNVTYEFYGHTARIKKSVDTYKFDLGRDYWWIQN